MQHQRLRGYGVGPSSSDPYHTGQWITMPVEFVNEGRTHFVRTFKFAVPAN